MRLTLNDALIVVDVQKDFCRGGALETPGAEEIVPLVNRLIEEASAAGALVVASRDWHPRDHVSFRDRGGPWPPHCVQATAGAQFHGALRLPKDALIVSKGAERDAEQYSVFAGSGLAEELRRRGVRRVAICGVAFDVCVRAAALDAARAGFETHVVAAATRPVSAREASSAMQEMTSAGIVVE